jgi:hypothetical protein
LRRIHQAPFRCTHAALTVPYALFDQSNKGTCRRASDPARADARGQRDGGPQARAPLASTKMSPSLHTDIVGTEQSGCPVNHLLARRLD